MARIGTVAKCRVRAAPRPRVAAAADCWPAPEVADNVNRDELGDLKLTPKQEEALVAFLKTLSDGWD